MALIGFSAVLVPASTGSGAAVDARSFERKTFTAEGTFGTCIYQLQTSNDPASPPAANSWTNAGSTFTSAISLEVSSPCAWLRVTANSGSGATVIGRLAGVLQKGG